MKNKERGPKFKAQGKTQTSSIKQSTQQRGKWRTKKEDPSPNHKAKPKHGHKGGKGINYVLKPPLVTRSILKNQREGRPKRAKEPSLVTMTCLKIEMACAPYKVLSPSTYRKHIEPPEEGHHALCWPHHVSTSMEKFVCLLMLAIKISMERGKKHIHQVLIVIKFLLCLSCHCCNQLVRWNNMWNQICSNGVGNDSIDQIANAITWQQNINLQGRRLKRRQWKDVSLFTN